MKIVYLTNNINPKNGWGRYASDLIYGVKNSGNEIIILKEEDDGFEGVPILKRGLGIFSSAFRIKKFIKNCDIIHSLDSYPYGPIGAIANVGINKKFIITGVGTYAVAPLYNYPAALLLKWAYKKADKVLAISDYTKEEILKKIDLDIAVIKPGIKSSFSAGNIFGRTNILLSVGALKFRKGYHISIPAFVLVKKKIPDLKYKIVGSQQDNIYFDYLKRLAAEGGVEKNIEFLDDVFDEELRKLYQAAKLFILTSVNHNHHFEGFGLVFLEASAAGLPVIGTKGNGIEDAVRDGYNGILAEQNDVEGTAKAIADLLSDQNKWSVMSKNSYQWSKSNNMDLMIKQYLDIYNNL